MSSSALELYLYVQDDPFTLSTSRWIRNATAAFILTKFLYNPNLHDRKPSYLLIE